MMRIALVATLVVVTVAPPAIAQTQQAPAMSMADMIAQCREHHRTSGAAIDRASTTLREARQSNDPARMQAALDQAQKLLAEMKEHMTMCMNMMSMMQQMAGGTTPGGMGMMGGMMSGGQPAATQGQPANQGMQGMACCMPSQALRGATGAAVIGIGVLLALSMSGALIALTVFLWKRSRLSRAV